MELGLDNLVRIALNCDSSIPIFAPTMDNLPYISPTQFNL